MSGKVKLISACFRKAPEGKRKTKVLSNGPDVARQLLDWLEVREVILSELQVILEPTGTYHEHLAYRLHKKGLLVVIASPVRVQSFATGMCILTKNDHADAHVLALYGALRQPQAWVPPPPAIRELKALLKRRDALREDLQREQNWLEKLHVTRFSTRVEASVTQMIAALDAELLSVQQQIDAHIDNHPDLKQDMKYLTSVKGIGKQVGSNMLAVLRGNSFSSTACLFPRPAPRFSCACLRSVSSMTFWFIRIYGVSIRYPVRVYPVPFIPGGGWSRVSPAYP